MVKVAHLCLWINAKKIDNEISIVKKMFEILEKDREKYDKKNKL